MPQPGVQLLFLVAAVPLQYLISKWTTPVAVDREYLTRRLLTDGTNIFWKACNLTEWKLFINHIQKRFLYPSNDGECAAREVMLYNEPKGYFSGSPEPKVKRKGVKYRIGQVIKHRKFAYRGVIIGWDYNAQAPDTWLQVNHFDPNWRYIPNYSVLVDMKDRTDVQTTYVAEENIEIITNSQIEHPEIDSYFASFDGSQYEARPWLKELYPKD